MESPPFANAWLGYAYGAAGRRDAALATIEDLKKKSLNGQVAPFNLAMVHLGLGDHPRREIDTGRIPSLLHLGDGALGRAHVAGRADPARAQARGQRAAARAQGRDVQWDRIAQVDDVELRAQEANLAPLALERPLERLASQQALHRRQPAPHLPLVSHRRSAGPLSQ